MHGDDLKYKLLLSSPSINLAAEEASCIGLAMTIYIYTLCMTVYLVISLPKIPYMHRIYMVRANPTHAAFGTHSCDAMCTQSHLNSELQC